MKSPFKKFIYQTHLILGLVSGIVVFIVSLTGACWAFQKEITEWVEGEISIEVQENMPFILADEARRIALEIYPDKTIHGTAYGKIDEPIQVIFYQAEPEFYHTVFLHPQTGKVLKTKNHREGFFWFVLKGHIYLWLPKVIGSEVTRYGTMIFVVLLITGVILWLPKKKIHLKQRLKFKWKKTTRWRRKNYDLHHILGFYISTLALVIAFSGLIMAFNWVYFVTYKTWGGDKDPRFVIPENIKKQGSPKPEKITVLNELVPKLMAENPSYHEIELHYPTTDTTSIYVEVSHQEGVYYSSDYRFFDQNTGKELNPKSIYGKYDNASIADKVIRMNYDIHIGAIGGIIGKIIAFVVSLLSASLPITGFLLWWGRKNKAKK